MKTLKTIPLGFISIVLVSMVQIGSLSIANADQPQGVLTSSESNDDETIEVRYARARLGLAKLDLRRAIEWNKRVPNLLSTATIEKLRQHVVLHDEQLKQCLRGENTDFHEVCIRSAEIALVIAKADVTRTRAIHERMPSASTELDVERALAVATIAELNLEKTRTEKTSQSLLSQIQRQIEELRVQVLELQLKLEIVASR
jgi:hypothetical protein